MSSNRNSSAPWGGGGGERERKYVGNNEADSAERSHHVSCLVLSCRGLSCRVLSCRVFVLVFVFMFVFMFVFVFVVTCLIMSCHAFSCHVSLCPIVVKYSNYRKKGTLPRLTDRFRLLIVCGFEKRQGQDKTRQDKDKDMA